MNVSFKSGEVVNGYTIITNMGLTRFVAKNDNIRIVFETDAGEGRNYSKVLYYTDLHSGRTYKAQRYLYKYVQTVQSLSNVLFRRWQDYNLTDPQCICGIRDCLEHRTGVYSGIK
jgi:hypothetical protein